MPQRRVMRTKTKRRYLVVLQNRATGERQSLVVLAGNEASASTQAVKLAKEKTPTGNFGVVTCDVAT